MRMPGFMPMWSAGRSYNDVRCVDDDFAPFGVTMYVNAAAVSSALAYTHGLIAFVIASGATWAARGANNIAAAHRPEGIPR